MPNYETDNVQRSGIFFRDQDDLDRFYHVRGDPDTGALHVVDVQDKYKRRRRYYDADGLQIYVGRNTAVDAALADETWSVWRHIYDADGLEVDVQGPLTGAVDDEAACAALDWPALT